MMSVTHQHYSPNVNLLLKSINHANTIQKKKKRKEKLTHPQNPLTKHKNDLTNV